MSKNSSESKTAIETYNCINRKQDIPRIYHEVNKEIFKNGSPSADLDMAIHISIWLLNNIKGGRGLSLSSDKVLKLMLDGDGGVCSDMAQVFNNFCVINDIMVKEWGITTIPFNRKYGGHSVNEIFSKRYNKWVLIDVSKGLMVYLEGEDIPLSVVELYQFNKTNKKIIYKFFIECLKVNMTQVDNYYLNNSSVPFLVSNYSNKIYDSFLNRFRPHVPVFVIHFLIYLFKKSYRYKFPLNDYKKMFTP